ncbi:MAG TPA: 50S ribosomal protein L13 [Planctomycetota bacterium]|jgi:large subunit ribosomal protein L13|nr:50S ribosomal protein L13 [Planctomycetota bacterium]
MPTTHVRSADLPGDLAGRWLLYDASKFPLGRLAAQIAMNLMGKDQPTYTPSEKNGAFVVVVNAEKIKTTGVKADVKTYAHYTGYPGGRREVPFARLQARRPGEVLRLAVKRMLPKTALGHDLLSRLKVYAGPEHPHAAQKPATVEKIRA